ncbi:MAG TPA: hypothetical protein VGQ30_00735 [Gemmatimonadaceae bacterium]|jgi:hypothetical protein|nr:hypothetical protein [Gemmatimonadaceae bacterium]
MRRSLSARVFAALFAPWFAFVVAEPVPLHDCPVHSIHAVEAPAAEAAAPMMANGEMDHAAMAHAAPAHHHGAPEHAGHHQCCCLGMSCASTAVALVPSPMTLAWIPLEIQRVAMWPASTPHARASGDHTLPFANGPPALRV